MSQDIANGLNLHMWGRAVSHIRVGSGGVPVASNGPSGVRAIMSADISDRPGLVVTLGLARIALRTPRSVGGPRQVLLSQSLGEEADRLRADAVQRRDLGRGALGELGERYDARAI